MSVSAGNLNDLLLKTYPATDFGSIAIQSSTGVGDAVSTVNVTTTGTAGPGATPSASETLNIVAIDNTANSLTVDFNQNGMTVGQLTEYIIGYNPNYLLLSTNSFAVTSQYLNEGTPSAVSATMGVLSPGGTVPAPANLAFSSVGSYGIPALAVVDTTTNQPVTAVGQPYTGPVAGITQQYISGSADGQNITTGTPNWFIHGGSGTDAINVSKGNGANILDGATGSNFLTGGSGNDTFFLDDRGPPTDVFSTVVGFHSGDNATVFGVNPSDFVLKMLDNQGAAGFLGLDLSFSAVGKPNANIVLAGYSSADLSNGRLSMSYGTTPDTPGVPGSQYLLIHAN